MRVWKYLTTNQSLPLDQNISIFAKTLSPAHAAEYHREGRLPDAAHTHDYERTQDQNHGGAARCKKEEVFIRDPPSDGPFLNKCLLLSLILARAKQIFIERRPSSKKNPHPDCDIPWRLLSRCMESDGPKKDSARNNLKRLMLKLEEKCPKLKGTSLEEVIPSFCEFFGDVEVFVICPETSMKKFKFSWPQNGAGMNDKYKIFLFQEKVSKGSYHIQYIDSIKTYAKVFGGLECLFRCGFIGKLFQSPHGKCRPDISVCDFCHFVIEKNKYFEEGEWNLLDCYHCDGQKSGSYKCSKCKFTISSERCFMRHKLICENRHKCEDCGKHYSPTLQNHKCKEKRCFSCKGLLPSEVPKKISDLDKYQAIHQV